MSVIGADDYVDFCEGLRQICGVDLSQYKRPQMERRLRSFVARKGISRLTDCLDALRQDRGELDALLDRVTINVSQLWRHPEQWIRLERDVLPELARAGSPVRAWSAGCSYGAEVYTLAAVCRTAIPTAQVSILGTDIDKRMIERANAAVFSDDDARGVSAEVMERGFERIPGGWRAGEALRRMATFELGDLLRVRPRWLGFFRQHHFGKGKRRMAVGRARRQRHCARHRQCRDGSPRSAAARVQRLACNAL